MARKRMTGRERREQLIAIGRKAFAELGFDGASVEEIAARAEVTKPVVYEHFGGKEGLYAVVVDREMLALEKHITQSLEKGKWREKIEQAALAILTYVEEETDGFVILARDSKPTGEQTFGTLLNTAVEQVAHILGEAFEHRQIDPQLAVVYAQALVGMVAMTAQWWLDNRYLDKHTVAAHIVNLCWNGLSRMEKVPKLADRDAATNDTMKKETE